MKKRNLVLIFFFLAAIILLAGCSRSRNTGPEVFDGFFRDRNPDGAVEVFDETFNRSHLTFDMLADDMRLYSMSLILGTSEIQLQLWQKDDSWTGAIRYSDHAKPFEERTIESFDAIIVEDSLIISSEPRRQIPVADFFVNQFDPGLFSINRARYGDFGMSQTAIVTGIYDKETARAFMELFYENFISIFPGFNQSDRYFYNIDRMFYSSFRGLHHGRQGYSIRLFFNDESELKAHQGQQRDVAEMIFIESVTR